MGCGSAQQPGQHIRPLGSVQHRQLSGEPVAFAATEVNAAARNSGGVFLKCSPETPFLPFLGHRRCPAPAQ